MKELLERIRAKRARGSIVCISGEPEEIRTYYRTSYFTASPLTVMRMRTEYDLFNRQFAFVYGPEECIPDPMQRAQALRQPYVPNDPRYYARSEPSKSYGLDDYLNDMLEGGYIEEE